MGCREGFISVPKQGAPERFSIQTGLICNLFGAQHPLCKWVDEILPELPFADTGKDIAKRIRTKLKDKISTKLLKEFDSSMLQLTVLNGFLNQIQTTNQLIDDIWNTLQGGEVSTLEFCLAGKPELPASINWGDIFLAFTRVYPDSLLEKLSQIIAFEKYFELCECVPKPYKLSDLRDLQEEIRHPIPTNYPFPATQCGQDAQRYYQQAELPRIQWLNEELNTIESWTSFRLRTFWEQYPWLPPWETVTWEIIPCPNNFEAVLKDIKGPQISVRILSPSNDQGSYCCTILFQRYSRIFELGNCDIKFTYPPTGQGDSGYFYRFGGGLGPQPCDEGHGLSYSLDYHIPIGLEDKCERELEPYPEDYDFRIIEPINPVDPCDSEYAENYGDLCNCPPACQEQQTIVRIIRDCNTVFEPRSLYLP
jgi:hypothetical protein